MKSLVAYIGIVLIIGASRALAQQVVFADQSAAPGGTGQSWGAAFDDLQDALDFARPFAAGGSEIQVWVAKGTYHPNRGTSDRRASFQLMDNVALYGGFAGNETQLHERDVVNNPTVLSGDLLGDDPLTTVNVRDPLLSDNSVHVVNASGVGVDARLDGFSITGGVAYVQGGTTVDSLGGAIYIENGSPTVLQCTLLGNLASSEGGGVYSWLASNPTFEECTFMGNYAQSGGAVAHRDSGVLTLIGCDFVKNSAADEGGAVLFDGVKVIVDTCSFMENVTRYGAAIYDYGFASEYTDCLFEKNTATGGAILLSKSTVRSRFTSCVFIDNRSSTGALKIDHNLNVFVVSDCTFENNVSLGVGGGLYVRRGNGEIGNSEFRGNVSGAHGGGLFCDASGVTIDSCLFEDNSATGTGGAIKASPVESISDCIFRNNTAISGGALWTERTQCIDSIFEGNTATARGGAVHCERDVVLDNCIFVLNQAESGGAVSIDRYANPIISRSQFIENRAIKVGGAISSVHFDSPRGFQVDNCAFTKNSAVDGGAIHGDGSHPVFSWCRFVENYATDSGGAVIGASSIQTFIHSSFVMNIASNRGGALCGTENGDAVLTNCLLVGNKADIGGCAAGIQFSGFDTVNCTIVANVASDAGGGFSLIDSGEVKIRNSILWGNSDQSGLGEDSQVNLATGAFATVRYSCITGWSGAFGGTGNHGEDPSFYSELGPDGLPGTGDEDLRLNSGSPCVDAGENSVVPAAIVFDLDGLSRFVDDPLTSNSGPGSEPHIDYGVYEIQVGGCYADCDKSTGVGVLDIFDFLCFQESFVSAGPYACGCDVSTGVGLCDIFDFLCFQSAFAAGCP